MKRNDRNIPGIKLNTAGGRILAAFLALCLSALSFTHAAADEIDDARQQVENTQQEIRNNEDRIDSMEGEQAQVESRIDVTTEEIAALMATIALQEEEIGQLKKDISVQKKKLKSAEKKLEKQSGRMQERIKTIYEEGEVSYLEVLLTAASYSDMLSRSEYVSQLYAYDLEQLEKYRSSSESAAQAKAELTARQILEKEAEDELEKEEERLEEALAGLRESYDDYDERLAAAKSRAQQLRARLEEQKAYLNRLEEKKRREEAEAAAAAAAQAAREAADAAWTSATETSSAGYVNGIPVHMASDLNGYRQPSGNSGQDVVNFACQFVGRSYVWGGTSLTRGCDCSGFTQTLYSLFGYSIPRTAEMQLLYGTEVDSLDHAKPGDLICYAGHVALYMGDGRIVHAASTTSGIIYGSATYRTILGIRRIIN